MSTVALTHNPILHTRTKHMELDIFFVREKVLNKSLTVQHIPSLLQRADIFTKALSSARFHELKVKLNVFDKFTFVQALELKGEYWSNTRAVTRHYYY